MKTKPIIVLTVGALFGLLATTRSARAKTRKLSWDEANPRIRALAGKLERALNWPGLATYLVAVGYWESRGNPLSRRSSDPNSERGWFQIRPATANDPRVTANPDLLYDEQWAVALAADLIWRLHRRLDDAPWLAIRRGWKYPRLVSDVNESDPDSPGIRERFEEALRATGAPAGFMYRTAVPGSLRWPGVDEALAILRS